MLQLSLRSTLALWDIPTSSTLVHTALLLNESHQLLIVSVFTLLSLDNGKEFIAKILVVEMMLAHNPNCFIVTGRPRTLQDQGSVESANKLVQRILKSILSERCLRSLDVNWTNLLGKVMSVCNSHSGRKKYSVSSYEAVFGQRFHPQLKCKQEEMRQCRSIFQRLKLSPDERLETYVRENDIVDIGYDDDVVTAAADIVTDDDDADDEDDEETTSWMMRLNYPAKLAM